MPPEQVAALLGVSVSAVMTMIAGHRLVALKKGEAWLVPGWQLDPDGEQGIVPGIDRAWAAFPAGVVPFCRWMTRPSVDLDDRTPRDVLAAGDVDTVAQLAEQLTAAGW